MKKLICLVVRHGETQLNAEQCYRSRLDPPLDSTGESQAEAVAKFLKEEYELEKIVSSPLLRSMQTADIIAEEFNLPVEQERSLFPWNLGFLGGKDKERYQGILGYFIDNPKEEIPDGESLDALEERIMDYFGKALQDETTLTCYVTHTSDLCTLENIIAGNRDGRPEAGEESVEPGGAVAIFVDDDGKYTSEVVFGTSKKAEYGS